MAFRRNPSFRKTPRPATTLPSEGSPITTVLPRFRRRMGRTTALVTTLKGLGSRTTGDVTLALTGVAAAAVIGTIGVALTTGVTGVQASGQVGSVSAGGDVTRALTGVAATGSVGSVAPASLIAITGATATGQVGSPGSALTLTVPGTGAVGAVGSVTPVGGTSTAQPRVLPLYYSAVTSHGTQRSAVTARPTLRSSE